MKKYLSLLLVAVLCLSILAACGNKNTTEPAETTPAESEAETPAETPAESENGEGEEAASGAIVGSWEYTSGGYVYTFNADGTGNYTAGTTVMEFTYTDKGDSVEILYTGNTAPSVFKYTISGNTLSIEDSFGEKVEYTKK